MQPEQCLYLALESQNTTVVLIADSKTRRDAWLHALRQLHGYRICDVRYAYPWQPSSSVIIVVIVAVVVIVVVVVIVDRANFHTALK